MEISSCIEFPTELKNVIYSHLEGSLLQVLNLSLNKNVRHYTLSFYNHYVSPIKSFRYRRLISKYRLRIVYVLSGAFDFFVDCSHSALHSAVESLSSVQLERLTGGKLGKEEGRVRG